MLQSMSDYGFAGSFQDAWLLSCYFQCILNGKSKAATSPGKCVEFELGKARSSEIELGEMELIRL